MEIIKKAVSCFLFHREQKTAVDYQNQKQSAEMRNRKSQSGMSLLAVMAVMTLFAISLLAVAPTIQQGIQRERELESIRRGEEIADAIRQYVIFYQGKLPDSMDDLLEGLPQGTKKRQILRPSAAVDPLSEDGKWRLIEPTTPAFVQFSRRVQVYNNGLLPSNPQPSQFLDRYAAILVNTVDTQSEEDLKDDSSEEIEIKTDKAPFIGVASQSRSKSIIAYYGIENHSKWIFTPMFRGNGANNLNPLKRQQELRELQNNRTNPSNVR
jgi:type II secretory pathway pseudopilin PulG